jgi:hypothetical protein
MPFKHRSIGHEDEESSLFKWLAGITATLITALAIGAFGFAWNTNSKLIELQQQEKAIAEQKDQHIKHWKYDAFLLKQINELRFKNDLPPVTMDWGSSE